MVKQVAPLRQQKVAQAGGQAYVWNVIFGRGVGAGGRGFGVDLLEHASENKENQDKDEKTGKEGTPERHTKRYLQVSLFFKKCQIKKVNRITAAKL